MTEKNTLFPGRPDYVGPTEGMFGLLHHDLLCERSNDVAERVAYVKAKKPECEVAVRLHNMIYLGQVVGADYEAKRAALLADYYTKRAALLADYYTKLAPLLADYFAKRDALYADYYAKLAPLDAEVLTYIRKHVPDCAWNEKLGKLVFGGVA